MTDKTLADRLRDDLHIHAGTALRIEAAAALDAKDAEIARLKADLKNARNGLNAVYDNALQLGEKNAEIARLREALTMAGYELSTLGYYAHEGPMPAIWTALRK